MVQPSWRGNIMETSDRTNNREPVQPCVCGEHPGDSADCLAYDGSSPRVRGTLHRPHLVAVLGRFIPACAGNTRLVTQQADTETVHPRVCGEHVPLYDQLVFNIGSSPRVRGTRRQSLFRSGKRWFIPACAGNTASSSLIRTA